MTGTPFFVGASLVVLLLCCASNAESLENRQDASIPDFVTKYAPLVYIDINDPYLPSDIGAQVANTYPENDFTRVAPNETLSLSNLSSLNSFGNCTTKDIGGCPIYLTSRDDVSTNPTWLYGVLPDPSSGKTNGATSAAVIVNDHGQGTVDAYYFYFYAFNLGLTVAGGVYGNHVGDWEHTMLRFVDGKPSTIWLSAHDGGFVYTYDAMSKNGSRPLVYSSLGGHANYATPGTQARNYSIITLDDLTSPGPLWDPVASAYFYTFAPDDSKPFNGTFTPVAAPGSGSSSLPPVDWLHFLGRWGDKQYPDSDPLQANIVGLTYRYEDGPTGPLDKELNRNGTCPQSPCTTLSTLPVPSGNTMPSQTITRTFAPTSSSSSSASKSSTSTRSGTSAGTSTSTSASPSTRTTTSGSGTPTASPTPTGAGGNGAGRLILGNAWFMYAVVFVACKFGL